MLGCAVCDPRGLGKSGSWDESEQEDEERFQLLAAKIFIFGGRNAL